jgi:hypothetical protein
VVAEGSVLTPLVGNFLFSWFSQSLKGAEGSGFDPLVGNFLVFLYVELHFDCLFVLFSLVRDRCFSSCLFCFSSCLFFFCSSSFRTFSSGRGFEPCPNPQFSTWSAHTDQGHYAQWISFNPLLWMFKLSHQCVTESKYLNCQPRKRETPWPIFCTNMNALFAA